MGTAHTVPEIVLHVFESFTLEAAKFLLRAGKIRLTCSYGIIYVQWNLS